MHLAPAPLRSRHSVAILRAGCALALALLAATSSAHAARERVKGVTNFGRVTDTYFRGGEVTRTGLENLYDMGVRTVVDLTGKNDGEAAICRRLGMQYYSFPMDADERPDDGDVERILSILTDAREPVFAHCSAGKHRAGTIAALYRTRVQGWSHDKAWAEQKSYGFGTAKDHRRIYEYVYGRGGPSASRDRRRY